MLSHGSSPFSPFDVVSSVARHANVKLSELAYLPGARAPGPLATPNTLSFTVNGTTTHHPLLSQRLNVKPLDTRPAHMKTPPPATRPPTRGRAGGRAVCALATKPSSRPKYPLESGCQGVLALDRSLLLG